MAVISVVGKHVVVVMMNIAAVVSYSPVFWVNFQFFNLKKSRCKVLGASYNRVRLITEKIQYIKRDLDITSLYKTKSLL